MAVTYAIEFRVRPGREERFLEMIAVVLDTMRGETTFRNAILHRDPEDARHFFLYETWADHQEVLDVQLKREYRQPYEAALPELLEEPRRIAIWEPLRADFAGGALGASPGHLDESRYRSPR